MDGTARCLFATAAVLALVSGFEATRVSADCTGCVEFQAACTSFTSLRSYSGVVASENVFSSTGIDGTLQGSAWRTIKDWSCSGCSCECGATKPCVPSSWVCGSFIDGGSGSFATTCEADS